MKYVAKEITENVNISKRNPLKEFTSLLIGLVLIIFTTVLIVGFTADVLITRIPISWEQKLSEKIAGSLTGLKSSDSHERIEELFDSLVIHAEDLQLEPSLIIIDDPTVNAGALPGGVVILYTGLLKQAQSENEIAFVLAHELGHINNRDHLRGLGKNIALRLIASLFNTGFDSGLTQKLFALGAQRYSKTQELEADRFGVDLLVKQYGHAADATSFFDRVSKERSLIMQFSSTHPLMINRINAIEKRIKELKYPCESPVPYSYKK